MFLYLTSEKALHLIGPYSLVVTDTVIPAQCPLEPNSPYRQEYDWLYRYERRLIPRLNPFLRNHRHELIGERGILSEALSNAFLHGHRRDPGQPIRVRFHFGCRGVLVRIADSGDGFDFDAVQDRLAGGRTYYSNAGNGMRLMMESTRFGVFYGKGGRSFYLLFLPAGDLRPYSVPCPQTSEDRGAGTAREVQSAVTVARERDRPTISFSGTDRQTAGRLLLIGEALMRDVTAMTTVLGLGEPEQVMIQTPRVTLYMRQSSQQPKLTISLFNDAVNTAVARMRQSTFHRERTDR